MEGTKQDPMVTLGEPRVLWGASIFGGFLRGSGSYEESGTIMFGV